MLKCLTFTHAQVQKLDTFVSVPSPNSVAKLCSAKSDGAAMSEIPNVVKRIFQLSRSRLGFRPADTYKKDFFYMCCRLYHSLESRTHELYIVGRVSRVTPGADV